MIRAEVEGVGVLEFPDETSPDVVQGTVQRVLAENKDPHILSGIPAMAKQGATLGFADEIEAGIAAGYAKAFGGEATENSRFMDLYQQARDRIRSNNKRYRDAHPAASLATEIGAGIVTARSPTTGVYKALGKASPIVRNAVTGAIPGAVAGAGYSEGVTLGDVAADTMKGAGLGAAFGAAAPAALDRMSVAFRQMIGKPKIQVFDDAGQFTSEAIDQLDEMVRAGRVTQDDAQNMIRKNLVDEGVLTAEQAARFNLFRRRGVDPVRSDISQRTDDFVETQSALKRSGPVADRVADQNQQITRAVDDQIQKLNPITTNEPETNAVVYGVIDKVVTSLDDEVTKAYGAAREASRGQPLITLNRFAKAISDNRGSENATGGVVSFARQILQNKGLEKVGTKIDINKRGARTTGQQLKKLTVQEAEEIRQGLNSLHDSVSPMGRRLIRNLKNAIDDDVEAITGADLFEGARQAKTHFHQTIERARRNKFDKSSSSLLEDIIDNKVSEEKIFTRLKTARDDDFLKFREFLINSGDEGAQAWGNIKAQVLRDALNKAIGTMGKGEGGRQVWNARSFQNSLATLRKTKKFDALFNADEQALIDDIIEIGRLRVPPSLVQQGKGPTELAVEKLRTKILGAIPIVGDGAQDLLEAVAARKADNRILDATRETVRQLSR